MKPTGSLLIGLVLLLGCASPPSRTSGPSSTYGTKPGSAARVSPIKTARVMLLIDEKSLGTIATAETENMAIRKFRENGFDVVDQQMVRSNLKKDQTLLKMVGDNRGASALGLEFGADIAVVGEAVAEPSARRIAESNLRNYQAVVSLRAIRTDTAEAMTSASETASIVALEDVTGGSQALKQAGEKALDRLIAEVKQAWEPGKAGTHIVLTMGGIDQAWKLKAVREKLRGMTDAIDNVLQRSYTAGVAVFDVASKVPAEQLSEKLVLDAPSGLKLQVLQVARGKIELRAVTSEMKGAQP